MSRRKKRFRSRGRRWRPRFRRPKTIAIAPLAGLAAGLLLTGPEDWGSPIEYMKSGDFEGTGRVMLNNITGIQAYQGGGYNVDLNKILNPLDFSRAGAIKGMFFGLLAHKVANLLGQGKVFSGLPGQLKRLRV